MALQHLRSGTAHKRPIPSAMSAGQLAVNTNQGSPGLFFKDSNGDLVKAGPVHIGTNAPNSSPDSTAATALVTGTVYQILTVGTSDFTLIGASANTVGVVFTATGTTTGTGTVSGQQGNEKGELWLDTTSGHILKIYDGTAWRSSDTLTSDLVMNNANVVFEGATANAFETTLTVVDPTADRTITLPNVTGTVVTTGDTGTVTSLMIASDTIVDADVNSSAAISGSKIQAASTSNAGAVQLNNTISSTSTTEAATANAAKTSYDLANAALPKAGGTLTGALLLDNAASASAPDISFDGDANTGVFSPAADEVGISTGGSERLRVDSSGDVGIGVTSPAATLDLSGNQVTNVVAMGALDVDCSAGNYFTKTINGNSTFTFSNVPASRSFAFVLELTHTSGTVTWPSSVKFPADTAPTLTAGKTHLFVFETNDGGSRFRGAALVDYVN